MKKLVKVLIDNYDFGSFPALAYWRLPIFFLYLLHAVIYCDLQKSISWPFSLSVFMYFT